MTTGTERQTDRVCLPVVGSGEDGDTFSFVGNFISFLFHLVTPDDKICVRERVGVEEGRGVRGWEGCVG